MSLAQRMAQRGFDSDDDSDDESEVRALRRPRTCAGIVSGAVLQVGVYLKLNGKDISARKGTYCLGVCSCLVVVIITALMLTVMGRLPIIFMRLAELEEGEADLRVFASGQATGAKSLNYSKVLSIPQFSDPQSPESYNTPRSEFPRQNTDFWPLSTCRNSNGTTPRFDDPSTFGFLWQPNAASTLTPAPGAPAGVTNDAERCPARFGCPQEHCDNVRSFAATLFMIDFDREARMGLGRDWTSPSPAPGECIMHRAVAQRLQVGIGDEVLVAFNAADRLLQAFLDAELDNWLEPPYTTYGRIIMPLRVRDVVDNGGGKFASSEDNFVLIDFRSALRYMAPFLNPGVGARKRTLFAEADVNDNANEVIFNFPPAERTDVYAQRDSADVLASATAFATPIIATLGFNQVGTDLPIVEYVQANGFFALFLGLILSLLIFGLGFLCIVLIHSLLTVGVETRTFELGIMRMVGMTRGMLAGYVVTGALLFAIPAWVLGLVISQLGFWFLVGTLRDSLGVDISPNLTPDAIGYATLVGLGMPLVSSIAPIVSVLALDLPRALDTNRARTNAITYDIQRGGDYHINWTAAGIGLAMAIAGFLVYYLFPLALLTFNITLLFYIFFGILMGMLFGLVLLTTSFQGIVEIGVMYLFLFWESDAVFQLIRKNLVAHRPRNRKTGLMFAMSIGFLIFISVTASIQIESVLYTYERWYGGPLNVRGSGGGAVDYNVIEACDLRLRELQGSTIPQLKWTWNGAGLDDQRNIDNATIRTVGRYVSWDPVVLAVAPNYWETALDRYLIVGEQRDSPWPLSESLYGYDGSGRSVISVAMARSLALTSLDDPYVFVFDRAVGNNTVKATSLAQSEAYLESSPGISYSQYSVDVGKTITMSVPSLMNRGDGSILSTESLRFGELIILVDEATVPTVEAEMVGVIQRVGASNTVSVRNFYSLRDTLQTAVFVINIFFTFAQVMATFICYFALSSSMSTNIHEQSKEIGVLRCVGFRKFPLIRTYVWEAFVLVASSSLLGIAVGVVMGYTIVLQRALFTQLPLPFVFPWIQLGVVLGLSLLLAFLSSFWPIRSLLKTKAVSTIMRRIL